MAIQESGRLTDPKSATLRLLRNALIFQGLEDSVLSEISDISRFRALEKGEYLFRRGEEAYGFFIVAQGAVSLRMPAGNGRDRVIGVFKPDESFAEGTLSLHHRYPVDARAESAARVLMMDRARFLGLLPRHPGLSLRILDAVSGRNRYLVDRLEGIRGGDADGRLIQWLLKADGFLPGGPGLPQEGRGHAVPLPGTKTLLAAELGIAPETLSRCLSRLRRKGLIRSDGRVIHVLDPEGLRRSEAPDA